MPIYNHDFEDLKRELRKQMHNEDLHPDDRAYFDFLLGLAMSGEDAFTEEIERAKQTGVRNPAFGGDFLGWLDDDFDYENEDEDEDDESSAA